LRARDRTPAEGPGVATRRVFGATFRIGLSGRPIFVWRFATGAHVERFAPPKDGGMRVRQIRYDADITCNVEKITQFEPQKLCPDQIE
jgi:hypothetical protein